MVGNIPELDERDVSLSSTTNGGFVILKTSFLTENEPRLSRFSATEVQKITGKMMRCKFKLNYITNVSHLKCMG